MQNLPTFVFVHGVPEQGEFGLERRERERVGQGEPGSTSRVTLTDNVTRVIEVLERAERNGPTWSTASSTSPPGAPWS